MTAWELRHFSDVDDEMIISKRDSDSSSAVRVAGMDYFVPDKIPQPKNVLESMVWDREKDIERQKERFPQQRAMLQAKVAEGKFLKRCLASAVKESCRGNHLPFVISISRSALHYGKLNFAAHGISDQVSG